MSTPRPKNLKSQQSPVILDLCLRKPRSGKSRDYRDVIVFKKFAVHTKTKSRRFQIPTFSVFVTDKCKGRYTRGDYSL